VEALYVSPVIFELAHQPDGNMEVRASGIPSEAYLIQARTKLPDWETNGGGKARRKSVVLATPQRLAFGPGLPRRPFAMGTFSSLAGIFRLHLGNPRGCLPKSLWDRNRALPRLLVFGAGLYWALEK